MRKSFARCAWGLCVALGALSSQAQTATHQCRAGNGYYASARPCPADAGSTDVTRTHLQHYSGAEVAPRLSRQDAYRTPLPRQSEHVTFLSPQCAEISEAIRTGPSRGVRGETLSDLRREYEAKCREDEREAYKQLSDKQTRERDQWQAQRKATRAERDQAALQTQQCSESLRILHGKRQRSASMSDGEKADLARFEEAYRTRCPRG